MKAWTLLLLAALAGTSDAQPRVREARAHFEEAQRRFAVGEFFEAGEEYQLAYKAKPDAALLYNAAQSMRLANEPARALVLYRNYLQFYPEVANADEVREQIAKLKEAIAATERVQSSPPTGVQRPQGERPAPLITVPGADDATPTAPAAAVAPAPAADPSAAAPALTAAAPSNDPAPQRRPLYKAWWLWTVVGVAVAGAVVGLAVGLTVPSHSSPSWANSPPVGPGSSSALVSAAPVRAAFSSTPTLEVRW